VLLELTVAEQHFDAVMEVIRDGLKVIEVAERYGGGRQTVQGWLRMISLAGWTRPLTAPIAPIPASVGKLDHVARRRSIRGWPGPPRTSPTSRAESPW
jgi:transposase-like protein